MSNFSIDALLGNRTSGWSSKNIHRHADKTTTLEKRHEIVRVVQNGENEDDAASQSSSEDQSEEISSDSEVYSEKDFQATKCKYSLSRTLLFFCIT